MTFNQWAKRRGYRFTKYENIYTSPVTRELHLSWMNGENEGRIKANKKKLATEYYENCWAKKMLLILDSLIAIPATRKESGE